MFISKKRFNEAIKEAQEKAFHEADKARWQSEEMERLREEIRDINRRLEAIENKGKKRFKCPLHRVPSELLTVGPVYRALCGCSSTG